MGVTACRACRSSWCRRLGRHLLRILTVAVMVLSSSGCSRAVESVDSSIRALLARYSAAMRSGDAAALRGVLVPDRSQFIASQLRLQENLSGLKTDTFQYQPASQIANDFAGPHQQWRFEAILAFAVTEVDSFAVQRPASVGVLRNNDSWLIFDCGTAGLPWQFGSVQEERMSLRGQKIVVLEHPGAALSRRIAAEIPAALTSLTEAWAQDWRAGLLLIATGSDAEFAALAGDERSVNQVAAVADRVENGVAVGQRLVFAPGTEQLPIDQFRVALRRELFRAATRTLISEQAPLWLVEGVANYTARRQAGTSFRQAAPILSEEVGAGHVPENPPTNADFKKTSPRRAQAYEEAWSLAQYIADTFGEPKLKSLFRDGAALALRDQDGAIERSLGINKHTLTQRWRSWLITHASR